MVGGFSWEKVQKKRKRGAQKWSGLEKQKPKQKLKEENEKGQLENIRCAKLRAALMLKNVKLESVKIQKAVGIGKNQKNLANNSN